MTGAERSDGVAPVALLQVVVPDYRARFFELLGAAVGPRLEILSGLEDFEPSVRPAADFRARSRLRNHFLLRRRFLWQSGSLAPLLRADLAVMNLNPRILNVWIVLVLRRLRGKKTMLWGHAWPRAGRASRSDRVRHVMRALATGFIAYTDSEADELRRRMKHKVFAAPNALFEARDLTPVPTDDLPTDFVCVSRLTPAKKPDLLLKAFALARPALPHDARLVFVGEGPLRPALEAEVERAAGADRVRFEGNVFELDRLRSLYRTVVASVSPGYVGLNLVQSIGFGVPMLIARDEPHSPEIEAATEGENALFFRSDSPEELSSLLCEMFESRALWKARREAIASACAQRYTLEIMVSRFADALRS